MIEKLLLSKVELWVLLLILVLGCVAGVGFAHLAVQGAAAGWAGVLAARVARFPAKVVEVFENPNHHESDRSWPDRPGGFTYADDQDWNAFLLLSRFDADVGFNVTELIREGRHAPITRWVYDQPEQFAYPARSAFHTEITGDPATMRSYHPWLGPDGSLTFHFRYSPLYRYDVCANVVWRNDDFAFHHSIEVDADGNLWSPGTTHTPLNRDGFDQRLWDDHLVKVSPDGQTLFSKSVIEILMENGLINRMYVYHRYVTDPIHLNDIQPVPGDGPHWRRGDVFVSLAHLNMLMLYRPSDNRLLWWTQDRMMHQHDVDVLDDHRIAVYNNNRTTRSKGSVVVGHNEILVFDFASGAVDSPWREQFRHHDIRTISQGLADYAADGSVLIEESNYGRLVKLSANGDTEWEYINKSSDGRIYTLNWVRYIGASDGEQITRSLSRSECH